MKEYSKRVSIELKFVKCCNPKKEDIREFSAANGVELIE